MERLGELVAWAPSLTTVKVLPSVGVERVLAVMFLGMRLRCSSMRRNMYIELPRPDHRRGDGRTMGKLKNGHVQDSARAPGMRRPTQGSRRMSCTHR